LHKGIKRLNNKNQKRLRGAIINLCRAVPHCSKIKCPYAVYTHKSLKHLIYIAIDVDMRLPELPDNIAKRATKYKCNKMLLEYYGRQAVLKQDALHVV
jgi:hypothetical protein